MGLFGRNRTPQRDSTGDYEHVSSDDEDDSDIEQDHPEPTEHSSFPLKASDLTPLFDGHSYEAIERIGGRDALLEKLKVNIDKGLSPRDTDDIEARETSFGKNKLPKPQSKSLWTLMWEAFCDKTLILLSIAALISLLVGIYEDYFSGTNEPDAPRVGWVDGAGILVAVLVVVLTNSINDYQKERQFRKLSSAKADRKVKVLRSERQMTIPISQLVVGDIYLLDSGEIVAVDGVLVEAYELRVDESSTTGETEAVFKKALVQDLIKEEEETEEGKNADWVITSGSRIQEGNGKMVVCAVGTKAAMGKAMMSIREDSGDAVTPLQQKLHLLAERIAYLGISAAVLMFGALLVKYFVSPHSTEPLDMVRSIMQILIQSITIIVVAVPEGLPMAVTIALAYATMQMYHEGCLVRVLSACETMGCATDVCSDKTGTLTKNEMRVCKSWIAGHETEIHEGAEKQDEIIDKFKKAVGHEALELFGRIVAADSSAFEELNDDEEESDGEDSSSHCPSGARRNSNDLMRDITTGPNFYDFGIPTPEGGIQDYVNDSDVTLNISPEKYHFVGSKTDTALLMFTRQLGYEYTAVRADFERKDRVLKEYPFSSDKKCELLLVRAENEHCLPRLYVKGAPEQLLESARFVLEKGDDDGDLQVVEINDKSRHDLTQRIRSYAEEGLRVLLIGYREVEESECRDLCLEDIEGDPSTDGLVIAGIVGIEDPIREGVVDAVRTCVRAGVVVRMVTGDNITTASTIAKKCGILSPGGVTMLGKDFRQLSDEKMKECVKKLRVLARSTPEDKKKLVRILQEVGGVVAVTGDGTNDAPALHLADVGFSMGSGTEVAKESSDIVLLQDTFTSLVTALLHGRAVTRSVRRFLQFQLTVNITAVVFTFVSALISPDGMGVLTAVQLLWVNLIMDSGAALALATDPPGDTAEDHLGRPEHRNAELVTWGMWKMICGEAVIQTVGCLLLFVYGGQWLNIDVDADEGMRQLRTVCFNVFVFMQLFNEVNCRVVGTHPEGHTDPQDESENANSERQNRRRSRFARIIRRIRLTLTGPFHGIFRNKFFLAVWAVTILGQVAIVEFGGAVFKTVPLNRELWIFSLAAGSSSLVAGLILRLAPRILPTPKWDQQRTVTSQISKHRMSWDWAIGSVRRELRVFESLRRHRGDGYGDVLVERARSNREVEEV
ncbi:hypothetical protein HDU85_006706 [Gaertneriomyces sp. JEL0708]|nr:hypothetical protein HDU85_006706 [Gaertneriomyces sp. JEL0708]